MLYKYRYLPLITFGLLWLPLPIVAALLLPTVSGLFFVGGIGVWFLAGAVLAGTSQYYQTTKPTQALSEKLVGLYTKQDKAELKALIKGGANPYAYPTNIVYKKDRKSREPYGEKGGDIMSLAIQFDDKDMVEFLLDNGYDINHFIRYENRYTWYNHTPLMIAICHNKQDITKLLLRRGANKLAETYQGETANDMAVDWQMSLGTTTANDFPQKPPTRYSNRVIWFTYLFSILLVGVLIFFSGTLLPISVTLIAPTLLACLIPFVATGYIVATDYNEENIRILISFLSDYERTNRVSMPLIHVLHLTNRHKHLTNLLKKAIWQNDYPLVNALLTRGISPETYPKKDPQIQGLITNYPATVDVLLKIKDTNRMPDALNKDERALLTTIALQKHAYKNSISGWLKSFQTPTEPLLKDISPLPPPQVVIGLEQEHKDAIIEAGQSIINNLTILEKNTEQQKNAIQALRSAASKLSQDEWKPIKGKILLAFHTDKIRIVTEEINTNLGKIIESTQAVEPISDDLHLQTLIAMIQPKEDGAAAASSTTFSSTSPLLLKEKPEEAPEDSPTNGMHSP